MHNVSRRTQNGGATVAILRDPCTYDLQVCLWLSHHSTSLFVSIHSQRTPFPDRSGGLQSVNFIQSPLGDMRVVLAVDAYVCLHVNGPLPRHPSGSPNSPPRAKGFHGHGIGMCYFHPELNCHGGRPWIALIQIPVLSMS